ncbi:MAG: Gfo/Idh/MocA family oxidoreductase [Chitinophagales bacterium]
MPNETANSIQTTSNTEDIFNNKDIDAIVIATPVFTQYNLAKQALEHGKHVLLEKPMTGKVSEAEDLIALAGRLNKVLMVDHLPVYGCCSENESHD